jgi:hypothetical protein
LLGIAVATNFSSGFGYSRAVTGIGKKLQKAGIRDTTMKVVLQTRQRLVRLVDIDEQIFQRHPGPGRT